MRSTLPFLTLLFLCPLPAIADPTDASGIEFFEKKIRPILTAECAKCHSAEAEKNRKLKGGLVLDTRAAMLQGGDSGPAIVPGKAAESLLIQTLKYNATTQMPPKGKLPENVIADFEKWIALGAPDPRGNAIVVKKQVGMTLEEGRKFWAYQPAKVPVIPEDKTGWAINDIDRLILAGLRAKKLQPAAEADRATLIRRLYFDLLGIPPTPEQIDAFVGDKRPDAVEHLVDSLLAMPEFGERWGRHWLDVARFGESLTLRGFILKEAWRYRDYVIESFNKDIPFDQLIREQIAGDLLSAANHEERARQLIATTFLAMGNSNLEEQDKKQLRMDVVDEQLDVITKGFLAQTVTCARCHDHKFDPIPTKDYYALAGILRNAKSMEHSNVSKWIEIPLPVAPAQEAILKQHEATILALQNRIKTEKAKTDPKVVVNKGALSVKDVTGVVIDDRQAKKVGMWQDSQSTGVYIGEGYLHDQNAGKGEKTLTFQTELSTGGKYEVRLAYSHGTSRSPAVPVTVVSADGEKTMMVDMTKTPPVEGRYVSLGEHRFEKSGQSFVIVSNEGTKGHVTADAVVFVLHDPKNEQIETTRPARDTDVVKMLEAELKRLQETGPHRQMTMTVLEEKQIEDAKIHVRGNVHNLGEVAPRGFLRVATDRKTPEIATGQSGRKELAEWIASSSNPLTSRVMVNRTWHWLFGSGIVRTVDNFGTTGERPSNPELLDYLAVKFQNDGWSTKKLIREIVLSRTWRQSSIAPVETVAADPENQLFGRANRRRLDAEVLRDTILMVSGKLDRQQGGSSFPASLAADYGYRASDTRRSVYAPIFRNSLPEIFEVFDFADPSTVQGKRNVSTVAPQALFFMNNPFALEHAKHTSARLLATKQTEDECLLQSYRLILGRSPTDGEKRVAKKFLANHTSDPAGGWTALIQALFASADFRYVN